MKITLSCYNCGEFDETQGLIFPREMRIEGPLVFNRETKSQSQDFTCDECMITINVLIEVEQ